MTNATSVVNNTMTITYNGVTESGYPQSGSGSVSLLAEGKGRSPTVLTSKAADGWRNPTNFDGYEEASTPPVGTGRIIVTQTQTSTGNRRVTTHNVSGGMAALSSLYGTLFRVPWVSIGSPSFPDKLVTEATTKALNDVRGSLVNLGTMYGERNQTIGMLLGGLSTLTKAGIAMRAGQWVLAAQLLGLNNPSFKRGTGKLAKRMSLAEAWLSLQMGWLPLANDVIGCYNQLTQEPETSFVGRGTARTNSTTSDVGSVESSLWRSNHKTVIHQDCFVRLDYLLTDPALRSAGKWGLLNPIEWLWQLTRFSFIFDYLVPVGDYLSSLGASAGLSFRGGSITTKTVTTKNLEYTPAATSSSSAGGWVTVVAYSGSASGTMFRKDVKRVKLTSEPSGGVYFKNPFSTKRVANIVALLYSLSMKGK